MSNYYYIKDNAVCGPVNHVTLKWLRDDGQIKNSDKACKVGNDKWIYVSKAIDNDSAAKRMLIIIPFFILILASFFTYNTYWLIRKKKLASEKNNIERLYNDLGYSQSIIESAFIKLEIREEEAALEKLERGIWDKDYLVPFLLLLIIGSQAVLFIFIVKTKKEILLLKKTEGVTGNSGSTP